MHNEGTVYEDNALQYEGNTKAAASQHSHLSM